MFYIEVRTKRGNEYIAYKSASKAAVTRRLNKMLNEMVTKADGERTISILNDEQYEAYWGQMVEKTNLLSGKTYMERRDTPSYCSPSSESYWSM